MKLKFSIALIIIVNNLIYSQYVESKIYSKEITLYKSKKYIFSEILKNKNEPTQFEIIPLAAASSGELTTLLYRSENEKKEGLVIAFYGDYWNDTGVLFQGYGFKNFEKEQAILFLNKIEISIEENKKFLNSNSDNNNISFRFDDIDVLIWTNNGTFEIRLFWKNFDSTWEKTAYERSKRRFERKIK